MHYTDDVKDTIAIFFQSLRQKLERDDTAKRICICIFVETLYVVDEDLHPDGRWGDEPRRLQGWRQCATAAAGTWCVTADDAVGCWRPTRETADLPSYMSSFTPLYIQPTVFRTSLRLFSVHFCRAILCISAACAVVRCPSVCLSVRPSVTFVYSVETNKHILIRSPSSRPTILVFPCQTLWQYSDGNSPPLTASNAGGVGKNRDSRRISGYRIDDWWSANNSCDRPLWSLPHRPPRISESCLSVSQPAWTTMTKRREQNIICTQR